MKRQTWHEFAKRDGFESYPEMWKWFDKKYKLGLATLEGIAIRWRLT
jgi:hypothetical protein